MDCGLVLVDRRKTIEETTKARTKQVMNQLKKDPQKDVPEMPNDQKSENPHARGSSLNEDGMAEFQGVPKSPNKCGNPSETGVATFEILTE